MLVLSRKVNEKFLIGDNIEITIVSVSGDQVRIGIEAPKDIRILRSEVYAEIQQQNVISSSTPVDEDQGVKLLEQLLQAKIVKEK